MALQLEALDPQAHPEWAEAIDYYVQARHRFLEGEWRLTVESLPQCLASLVGKKADDEDQDSDIEGAIKTLRKESRDTAVGYERRLELTRQAAKFLCDLGAHAEIAETRHNDALGALVMMGGLLHALTSAPRK